jgi:hypothetical protein
LFLILRSTVWMDKYMVLWTLRGGGGEISFMMVKLCLMASHGYPSAPAIVFHQDQKRVFKVWLLFCPLLIVFWMIHLEWFLKLVCFASVSCLLWICGSIVSVESCARKLLLAPEIKSLYYLPICKVDNT